MLKIIRRFTTSPTESYKYLHEAVHVARNAYYYLDKCGQADSGIEFDHKIFQNYLISTLTATSLALSLATGEKCRASIKIIGSIENSNDMSITTIARDRLSNEKHGYVDKIKTKRIIKSKSAPCHIMTTGEDFFISNDLERDKREWLEYSTGGEYKKEDWLSENWPLPYISILLLPIRYILTRDEYQDINVATHYYADDQDVRRKEFGEVYYGFLGIDSPVKNTFKEEYLHRLGAIPADALFPIFDMYFKLLNKVSE